MGGDENGLFDGVKTVVVGGIKATIASFSTEQESYFVKSIGLGVAGYYFSVFTVAFGKVIPFSFIHFVAPSCLY